MRKLETELINNGTAWPAMRRILERVHFRRVSQCADSCISDARGRNAQPTRDPNLYNVLPFGWQSLQCARASPSILTRDHNAQPKLQCAVTS